MPSKAKKKAAKKAKRAPARRPAKAKRASKPKRPAKKRDASTRGIPDSILRLAEKSADTARKHKESAGAAEVWQTGPSDAEMDDRQPDLSTADSQPWTAAPAPAAHVGRATPSIGEIVIDVDGLHVFYGAVEALKGISFNVRQGETVSIIGSNGAGKTTTLKTVSGVSELLKHVRGRVTIMGERVESWPAHKIARLGVAHSPEGRKIFPNQTVRDNLMLGAFGRKDSEVDKDIDEQYARFPILGQRRNQAAGLMSGGEQQMLAMARALMARPKVILFDEPSMGLAPLIVKQIFEIIESLKAEGKTILLVEQMAFQALGIADRGYVLETGAITMEGSGADLLADPRVKEAYLGA